MTNIIKLPRLTTIACLALVLTGQVFLATPTMGQSSDTQDKIRLMSTAIRARDAGDLNQAKANLEELLRLAPNDVNVQRLLLAVNKDIERRDQGQATVYGQAANTDLRSATNSSNGVQATTVVAITENANGDTTTEVVTDDAGVSALDAVLEAEAASQEMALDMAKQAISDAKKLIKADRYADADALLAQAQGALKLNTATASTIEKIRELRGDILLDQGQDALDNHNAAEAATYLAEYREKLGDDERARAFEAKVTALKDNPWYQNPEELSPEFMDNQGTVDQLMVKARAQMLYGDLEGASATLREIEARDPTNPAAKGLQIEIMQQLKDTNYLDHSKTRDEMLQEVARSWQRPQIFEVGTVAPPVVGGDTILQKLAKIEIPRVSFAQVPLSRVVETLSELSVEYDKTTEERDNKGVNIVPANWGGNDPMVSITLRNLSLDKILDFVTQSVDYTWDVQNEAVVVRPGDQSTFLETEFFPISRGVVIRLTGVGDSSGSSRGGSSDPFAPAAPSGGGGNSTTDTEGALLQFFQKAGVSFEGTTGSSLAFDGTQLIVTQTPKNLEKMRNILRRYDQPKQVEIEAKFLEVNQGVLDELNFNWYVNFDPTLGTTGTATARTNMRTNNRSLSDAFSINSSTSQIRVNDSANPDNNQSYAQSAPSLPNTIDLGSTGGFTADVGFGIMGTNVEAIITALSRKEGSDLLSSPRLTVLSGRTAQIVVAQELRYPENYSDIESEVGSSSSTGTTTSAGVTITAGTPQDFTVRNVGVEMEVTPTVEEIQNISLKLEPRVTEFEGFVEYGGTSIAISSGITVSVPSGFYQPIFSTREVRTEVTVYDGATVVIGGLTREEVKTVNDKIPLLGDIPLLGRLFQSKGESTSKRNLLIFVTANLISPGGSPSNQRLRNVEANSLFQNPILVTPGGGIGREISEE
ncbi:MAG: type II secretory pathway, component PulD [Puniceicoccales bacterium]